MPASTPQSTATNTTPSTGPLEILIDGLCPLCKQEARLLARMDKGRGRLILTDITSESFNPADYDRTFEDVMGSIHARKADGSLVTGMEVFRLAYASVGWGWLVGWTKWPIIKPLVDASYRWFARNRLRLTGHADRCDLGRCRVS